MAFSSAALSKEAASTLSVSFVEFVSDMTVRPKLMIKIVLTRRNELFFCIFARLNHSLEIRAAFCENLAFLRRASLKV